MAGRKKIGWKQLVASSFLALTLVATALATFAPTANAAPNSTYTFTDVNTIVGSGGGTDMRFALNGIRTNGNERIFVQDPADPGNGCQAAFITIPKQNGVSATITWETPSGSSVNQQCSSQTQNVTVANPNSADTITFVWIDSATIQQIKRNDPSDAEFGGNSKFQLDISNPTEFYRGGDNDQCIDSIIPSADKNSGEYHLRTSEGNGGCKDETSTVAIAYAATNSGAAGTPTTGGPGSANSGGANGDEDPYLNCDITFSPLTWFLCPVIKTINLALYGMDNAINSLLTVDQDAIFDRATPTGAAYYRSWSVFRSFALALLVIAGIVMILAQALGWAVFDAYTIKKVLPRIVIAIIVISLSWYLMKFLVGLTNDLGNGIRQIIFYPFKNAFPNAVQLGGGGEALLSLIGAGAILALGIGGLLSFVVTAALGVGIAFLVLILRQMVIILLVLLAPIAIACSVLPNTQGAYKLWYESFTKALMMFPIIAAFVALGRVFSVATVNSNNGGLTGAVTQIIALAAYILPYFLIPLTFKLAGGALRVLGGSINDRNRGAFDRLRKFRQGQFAEHGGRRIHDANSRIMEKRAGINDKLLNSASKYNPKLGGRPGNWVRRKALVGLAGGVSGHNIEAKMSARRAEIGKELGDQIATGRDEEIRALTVDKKSALKSREGDLWRMNNGRRQFKSLGGKFLDEAYVDRAQSRWGGDTFAQQAALSYEMRKASTEDDLNNLARNYNRVAKGAWGMTDGEAGGAWMGAAFENQGSHLEYKYTDWKTGNMSTSQAKGFVDEIYEKKGSYEMARMTSSTFKQLENAYDGGDEETRGKVQSIAETFVSRYGGGAAFDPSDPQQVAAAQSQANPQVVVAPVTGPGAGQATGSGGRTAGTVTTNAAGAPHVAERVNKLAYKVGVLRPRDNDPGQYSEEQPLGPQRAHPDDPRPRDPKFPNIPIQ